MVDIFICYTLRNKITRALHLHCSIGVYQTKYGSRHQAYGYCRPESNSLLLKVLALLRYKYGINSLTKRKLLFEFIIETLHLLSLSTACFKNLWFIIKSSTPLIDLLTRFSTFSLSGTPSAAAIESNASVELQFFFRSPSVRLRRFPIQMSKAISLLTQKDA
jgi:hypothetical protein